MAPRLDPTMAADLVVFRAVAEAGGFTAAAPRLGVTQGAVSQRIGRLEGRLRCRLFARGRRLELTPAGARLLAVLGSALDAVAEVLPEAAAEAGRELRLRISCSATLALEWLGEQIDAFLAAEPRVEVELIAEDGALSAEALRASQIDLAIRYGPARPPGLRCIATLPSASLAVCAPEYLRRVTASALIVRLHDAQAWQDSEPADEWDRYLVRRRALAGRAFRDRYFNLAKLAWDAAAAGEGVAIGRLPAVAGYLSTGRLVPATVEPPVRLGSYHAIVPGPGSPPTELQRFVSFLLAAWKAPEPRPEE
jgi:DNA-binding transcriptional LysR family regulator